ncbi:MAG: AAA family ATPase [Cetobacterium sp.]
MAKEVKTVAGDVWRNMTVTGEQLEELLRVSIPARFRTLIVGAPGTGKTAIVSSIARALGYDYIEDHPGTAEPTDMGGFPSPNAARTKVEKLPIGNLHDIIHATNPTVWALEDIGAANSATQVSLMPWLHAQKCNGMSVPKCVSIVGTSNLKGQHARVEGMLEPVKSRWHTIVRLEMTYDYWSKIAIQLGFAPAVIGYLNLFPEALCEFKPTAEFTNSPNPRTWEAVSRAVQMGVPKSCELAVFSGAVGEGQALQFVGWMENYRAIPELDAVWTKPEKAPIPEGKQQHILWAYLTALCHHVDAERLPKLTTYLTRLLDAKRHEMVLYAARTIFTKDAKLAHTPGGLALRREPRMKEMLQNVTLFKAEGV